MKTLWAIYRLWRQGRLHQIQRITEGPTFEEASANAAQEMRRLTAKLQEISDANKP